MCNSHWRWCGYSECKSRSTAAEFGRVLCRPPLELLELSDTRPLSMTRAQNEALYAVRRPLYEAFCDYSVRNLDIDTAVSDIIQAFDAHFGEM